MKNFTLSTDTCCDELKSNLKKMDISYIPMTYIYNDELMQDNMDSMEDYKFFYDEMKRGKIFSTTGLNPLEIEEYFKKLIEEKNMDILHVSLSSGLSGTCTLVKQVAEEINKTSNCKVYVLDSLCATQVQNYLLDCMKILRDEGLSASEALKQGEELAKKIKAYFFLGDLEALRRGGRISGAAAMIGKTFQLKPILTFDEAGKLKIIDKVMGVKKAIRSLIDKFNKEFDGNTNNPIYLAFAGDMDNAIETKNILLEKFPNLKIITGPIGPVIASHTGPSLTAIIFLSK
ncbi:MAG: DegV family protein [Clostridia bacterium]|nr:DegV family protein [Clostridia bacterium]